MSDVQNEPEHVEVKRIVPPPLPMSQPTPVWRRPSYLGALAVAGLSDVISVGDALVFPVQLAVDLVTAIALWMIMGFRLYLLLPLIVEAIPGVAMFPTWLLVVAAYGVLPLKPAEPPVQH